MKTIRRSILSIFITLLFALPALDSLAEDLNESAHCMALALYWEAKTEGTNGMYGVGHVLLNRVNHTEFPSTVCEVMRHGGEKAPCQFSFWCDGKSDRPDQESGAWQLAKEISKDLVDNPPTDTTNGALFFHVKDIEVPWSIKREKTTEIGQHIFYR
jgi:N-acetylmuramoyl-L-alanine amidase